MAMAQLALGMVETRGLTAAIEAADAMTKAPPAARGRQDGGRHLRRHPAAWSHGLCAGAADAGQRRPYL